MKKLFIVLSLTGLVTSTNAQKKTDIHSGYKTLESGLGYKMLYDAPGDKTPKAGDFMEIIIVGEVDQTSTGDSVIFDSRDMNAGKPVEYQAQAPGFKGDLMEGIFMMTAGDSAMFKLSIDSLVKTMPNQKAPWMKEGSGQNIYYHVSLISVKSAEEREKQQKKEDEVILTEYFKSKNIKATQTKSGLYYKIEKEGTGAKANAGDTVVANYTGMSLEGKKFDSNVDPAFNHVQPFEFAVGMGQVIRGWDEGFQIFKTGTKATLYVPSYLAYGKGGPNPNLPENGILVFEIELVNVKPAAKN